MDRIRNAPIGLKVALAMPTGLNGDTGDVDADVFRAELTYT